MIPANFANPSPPFAPAGQRSICFDLEEAIVKKSEGAYKFVLNFACQAAVDDTRREAVHGSSGSTYTLRFVHSRIVYDDNIMTVFTIEENAESLLYAIFTKRTSYRECSVRNIRMPTIVKMLEPSVDVNASSLGDMLQKCVKDLTAKEVMEFARRLDSTNEGGVTLLKKSKSVRALSFNENDAFLLRVWRTASSTQVTDSSISLSKLVQLAGSPARIYLSVTLLPGLKVNVKVGSVAVQIAHDVQLR